MEISQRQIELLRIIVDEYTLSVQPVPSSLICKKYMKDLSPQTIRNDLFKLEQLGLLEKTHTSSGRVPSAAGYKYYEENILKPLINNDVKAKLQMIFSQRNASIDEIVNESASLIEEFLKLPTVIHNVNSSATLKRFDLIPISSDKVIVLLITSDGEIIKNDIRIEKKKQLEDVMICVRIFNDRLIDTKLSEIEQKMNVIKELIRKSVHQYEFVVQEIIKKIFAYNKIPNRPNIYGLKNLALQPEFKNVEHLEKVLSMLENSSVWKQIAYQQEQSGQNQITFNSDVGVKDVTIASTVINTGKETKQISIVGPNRMNYAEVKGLLQFLKDKLEKR
ncbi:MAG: heat-inducible transcriptional repressor HrcA [Mycoplasma sp.]